MPDHSELAGLRVFVAEDEVLVLQLIEDMLADLGCTACESIWNVAAGLERAPLADAEVAVLDVNLRGKEIFPVAHIFRERGIPIVFSTGYGSDGIAKEWQGCPVIQKPFAIENLENALLRALAERSRVSKRA